MPEDDVRAVLTAYEKKGATGQFTAKETGELHCHECGITRPGAEGSLKALHRFEGDSDPSDESALAVIECPSCGHWGTIMLSYGPEASKEDQAVLSRLTDDRESSGIRPGS